METWKATIKEKGNERLLTPEYWFPEGGMFSGIADGRQREYEIRKFLRKFWGLDKDDIEWYTLNRSSP